jgi:hypothetical protein
MLRKEVSQAGRGRGGAGLDGAWRGGAGRDFLDAKKWASLWDEVIYRIISAIIHRIQGGRAHERQAIGRRFKILLRRIFNMRPPYLQS